MLAFKPTAGFTFGASFTFGTGSTLGEELHSDAPAKWSAGLPKLGHAQASCPSHTMTSSSTPLTVTVDKDAAPRPGPDAYA
ncbi:hypothetical protein ACWGLP_18885 [Streptomyces lydicus]